MTLRILKGILLAVFATIACCSIAFNSTQISALRALYDSTDGVNWNWAALPPVFYIISESEVIDFIDDIESVNIQISYNISINGVPWNFSKPNPNPCVDNWKGVGCTSDNSSIVSLILSGMNLFGTLPSNISSLDKLENLDFSHNLLLGSLPERMTHMSKLRVFNVHDNGLTGDLVKFIHLSPFRNFDISGNRFELTFFKSTLSPSTETFRAEYMLGADSRRRSNISDTFFDGNDKLIYFGIGGNQLTGSFPSRVCLGAPELRFLNSPENNFTSIPTCMGEMRAIRELDFVANALTGVLPTFFGKMTSLRLLFLTDNYYSSSIPLEFFTERLQNLSSLYINHNLLSGEIPSTISYLEKLRVLLLENNDKLSPKLPSEFFSLKNLEDVDISSIKFEEFPSGIFSMSSVVLLGMANADLACSIPSSISEMSNLMYLFLNNNFLTGTIPLELFRTNIKTFDFSSNYLFGTLPSEIFEIRDLQGFDVSMNLMEGTLPPASKDLTRLNVISLTNNYFHGSIPESWGKFHSIYELQVGSNFLTNSIPSTFYNLTSMKLFDINSNYITGTVPQFLFEIESMTQLLLFGNSLTGKLDFEFHLPWITVLLMQGNSLEGNIYKLTHSLSRAIHFHYFDISSNRLSGTLPSDIGSLVNLNTINLGVNCFSGAIPTDICNLTRIMSVGLDGLTSACKQYDTGIWSYFNTYLAPFVDGSIPECMWHLKSLTSLQVSGNGLSGSLVDLPVDTKIVNLTLSCNYMTGTIPSSIQHLSFTNLDLSRNMFNGTIDEFGKNQAMLTAPEQMSVNLETNRLSGEVPSVFSNVGSVNILLGNVFSCTSDLPKQDPNYSKYTCGSQAFDSSLIAFGVITVACSLIVGYVLYHRKYPQAKPTKFMEVPLAFAQQRFNDVRIWWNTLQTVPVKSELGIFLRFLHNFKGIVWKVSLFILIVGNLVFGTLKIGFHTVTYQYTWTVTGAFLWGNGASGVVYIYVASITYLVVYYYYRECVEAKSISNNKDSESERLKAAFASVGIYRRIRLILAFSVVFMVNCIIVLGVNMSYVLVYVQTPSSNLIALSQFALAIFKILWGQAIVPAALGKFSSDTLYLPMRQTVFKTAIILLNNVMIPCLAGLISLDSCFEGFFVKTESITSTYSWRDCESIDITNGHCLRYTAKYSTVTFNPPFIYNFSCTSGLLLAYIPVYIIMYTVIAFGMHPAYMLMACIDANKMHPLIRRYSPGILWPGAVYEGQGFPFKPDNLLSTCFVNFGVLISFGAMSPLLVISCSVCLLVSISFWEIALGRFIYYNDRVESSPNITHTITKHTLTMLMSDSNLSQSVFKPTVENVMVKEPISVTHSPLNQTSTGEVLCERPTTIYIHEKDDNSRQTESQQVTFTQMGALESSCHGIWESIWPSLWLLIINAIAFVAFFLLDTSGNQYDWWSQWLPLLWIPFAVVLYPLILLLVFHYFLHATSTNKRSSKKFEENGISLTKIFRKT